MKRFLLLALLGAFLSLSESFSSPGRDIFLLKVDGVINPAVADYLTKGLKEAERLQGHCVIIQLDTPGGLMESMRSIVKGILSSPIPVIVYVAPSGSRAGSAGVFITLAAHIAAMAPGTLSPASCTLLYTVVLLMYTPIAPRKSLTAP